MRMGIRGAFKGLTLVALLALSAPAAADDRVTCEKESGDVAIAACTRGIASGQYTGRFLAQLYDDRGAEYLDKSDYERAFADFNQALRINPVFHVAFFNRGLAYHRQSQFDQAVQEYDKAIRALREHYKAAEPNYLPKYVKARETALQKK
jgi:tetratricopeptide (TPR) repeat protein